MLKPEKDFQNYAPWVNPAAPWHRWRNVRDGIPKSLRYPSSPLYQVLEHAVELYPINLGIYDYQKNVKLCYREIRDLVHRVAHGLSKLGLERGSIAGIMCWNCYEYILALFGILYTGAICMPINPLWGRLEIEHALSRAGEVKLMIVDRSVYPTMSKLQKPPEMILIGSSLRDIPEFTQLFQNPPHPPSPEIDPERDPAFLVFTGGTEGLPKGVVLTHNSVLRAILIGEAHPEFEKRRGRETIIVALPMCHAFGLYVAINAIYSGHMMLILNRFEPKLVLDLIQRYRPRRFAAVPTMHTMLVNHPDFERYDLSSLESIVSAAASLPVEIASKWKRATGVLPHQAYGMTECAIISGTPDFIPIKPESVGIPLIDTDVKIVDIETGKELGLNQVGEIWVKCPRMFKEYWRDPEATAKAFSQDGYLKTGDLGFIDEDGYLHITGRKSEFIKSRGYRIFPDEVEDAIYRHPGVMEAGVIGVPDPELGEKIVGFVRLKEEYRGKLGEKELIQWLRENLAPYKCPKQIIFIDHIPKTHIGKIFRRKLKQMYQKLEADRNAKLAEIE